MRVAPVIGMAVLLALAGCAAPAVVKSSPAPTLQPGEFIVPDQLAEDVPVSADCLEAMRVAQGPIELDGAEAHFRALLDACPTPEEWVSAYRIASAEVEQPNPAASNEFGALIVTCLNAINLGVDSSTCDAAEAAGWLANLPPNDTTDPQPLPDDRG